jgi:Fe-S cluster biogenesis protein NfuA/nitrite reductase/ring-hydroxylating ferredoxin subunit
MDEALARELVGRVETLLGEVEHLADPTAREMATELAQALLELYGEGLSRAVELIAERDEGQLAQAMASDELVSHLLLLHGLHPVPLEDRVRGALAEVEPYLESHGGGVELLAIEEDAVTLALQGSCSGCPSSTMTLKLAIETAIRKAAPEIERIDAQDAVPAETAPANGLLQLEVSPALAAASPAPSGMDWTMAGGLPELASGGTVVKRVGGQPLLFLKLDSGFYGYRPDCPACGESLSEAMLSGVELTCGSCGSHYDVMRAGRCMDAPQLHLEPVPLLVDRDGLVKVALSAPV